MRARVVVIGVLLALPLDCVAQDLPAGGPLDPESYAALSAYQLAQLNLDGFRGYLEHVRDDDEVLYGVLDRRLDGLEERVTIADVVFGVSLGLGAAALITAIPVHEEVGIDPALGLVVAGASTVLLGIIVQAIVRPGHGDLMALIDLHDHQLGRR